jgi:hypothetical protein
MRLLWEQSGAELVEEALGGKFALIIGEELGVPYDDAVPIRHQPYDLSTQGNAAPLTKVMLLQRLCGFLKLMGNRCGTSFALRDPSRLKSAVHVLHAQSNTHETICSKSYPSITASKARRAAVRIFMFAH